MQKPNTKIDKPTFTLLVTTTNAALALADAVLPTNPAYLALKVAYTAIANAFMLWIGVEDGDITP